MDYLALALIGILGFWLGRKFAITRIRQGVSEKIKTAEGNEDKIVEFLKENGEITNNDVEKLLEVSDSTATRYLSEMEEAGIIYQNGDTGRGVYYTLR